MNIHLTKPHDSFSYSIVADGNRFSISEFDTDRRDGHAKTLSISREQYEEIMAAPENDRFYAAQRAFIRARKQRAASGDSFYKQTRQRPERDENELPPKL